MLAAAAEGEEREQEAHEDGQGQHPDAPREGVVDVVLAREPGQHASRYLRAAVKRALGREAEAREDLSVARHAAPGAAKLYEAWGLLEN